MTDFILGGILLTISVYIILKLLQDVLSVLVEVEPGQTRKIPRSSSCTSMATPSARSRRRSTAHGRARTSGSSGCGSRIRRSRTAHTRGGTGHDAA